MIGVSGFDLLLEMPERLLLGHQRRMVARQERVDRWGDEKGEQRADRHAGEDGDADVEARDRARARGEDERGHADHHRRGRHQNWS